MNSKPHFALQESKATLRLIGDDLIPKQISKMLGRNPTSSQMKGESLPTKDLSRQRTARTGAWHLKARPFEPEDIDAQVRELLNELTDDLEIWRQLAARYRVGLFCGLFMRGVNEGMTLSPQTLEMLGVRGIELGLDIYGSKKES